MGTDVDANGLYSLIKGLIKMGSSLALYVITVVSVVQGGNRLLTL